MREWLARDSPLATLDEETFFRGFSRVMTNSANTEDEVWYAKQGACAGQWGLAVTYFPPVGSQHFMSV